MHPIVLRAMRHLSLFACLGLAACGTSEPSSPRPADDKSPEGHKFSCDASGLSSLAASVTNHAPERAAQGLVERCDAELPPRLRWVIRTLLPEHEDELMRTPKPDPAETAIWDAACANHLDVLKSAAQAPSQERGSAVYLDCKLDRYGLLTEAELATREPSGLPLWVVHQWMLERGASPADARRISLGLFDQWDVMARRLAAGP
jgi:hypothetical protein